jgi:hypothetical protein
MISRRLFGWCIATNLQLKHFFRIRGVASEQLELVIGRCKVITLELKTQAEFI